MSANDEFKDIMHEINTIAQGKNFVNGRDWASLAEKRGELTHLQYTEYCGCHNLRNQSSHGNARDVEISYKTLSQAKFFLNKIKHTRLVGNKTNTNSNRPQNRFNGTARNNNSSRPFERKPQYRLEPQYNRKPTRPKNISFYGFEVERCIKIMRKNGNTRTLGDEISLERAVVHGLLVESKSDLELRALKYGLKGSSIFESKETLRNRVAKHMVQNVPQYEIAYLMTL